MTRTQLMVVTTFAAVTAFAAATTIAAQPAEKLLPATTKGFISTQDLVEAHKKFDETQLGALANDPAMQPFVDDLKRQVREKLERAGKGVGLTWKDLESVAGGEVAAALIQPDPKDKLSHASALVIDITGKKNQTDALLKKIAANQAAKKAKLMPLVEAGIPITQYEQPLRAGEKEPARTLLCVTGDQLIITDHAATMRGIVGRLGGKAKDALDSVVAYSETMKRCAAASGGVRFHVRWFLEPLGYAETSRAVQGGRKTRGVDPLKVLQSQGFTAIQGVGGHVLFATEAAGLAAADRPEILHRTFVYAPAVKRVAGAKIKDKYDLAMRMLDFPNSTTPEALDPQPWALPDVASYLSFHFKPRDAFGYAETLVDALQDDTGLFQEWIKGLKTGDGGAPPIDIYAELLDLLATRATLLSDVKLPTGVKSERQLGFYELKDAAKTTTVAKFLEKYYKGDERVKEHTIRGQVIWEIEQAPVEEAPAKGKAGAKAKVAAKEPRRLAVTALAGHLVISTHLDFIDEFLLRKDKTTGLAQEGDYQRVRAALVAFGSKNDSLRFFTRTEESYRANYELFKLGKLPESQTLLAGLLSALPGSGDASDQRKPAFDGSKLPAFDAIKKYLGPGGLFAQSENDGWWLVGCLLKPR